MNDVTYLNLAGRRIRFLNRDGLYPVNEYQSLVLAACSEMAAVAMASRLGCNVRDLSAWEPCCGGGPAAITLKALGLGRVLATDIDSKALETCSDNAQLNGLQLDQVTTSDLLNDGGTSTFDLISCNPPCGTTALSSGNPALKTAVDGGEDGMDLTVRLVQEARRRLTPRGSLLIITTSTGNITRLIRELDSHFPHRWHVFPTTPVAAPWMPETDARAQLAAAQTSFVPFTWRRPDGWLWRLSWVVEATNGEGFDQTGNEVPETGFPLRPFGYEISKDPVLDRQISTQSRDGYWLR